jgi:hypothetical protein
LAKKNRKQSFKNKKTYYQPALPFDESSPQDIHIAAEQIFGNSYYIDYSMLTSHTKSVL